MNITAIAAWTVGLLGFASLLSGVALIHKPTAMIVAGLCLLGWSWLADKAAARAQRGG